MELKLKFYAAFNVVLIFPIETQQKSIKYLFKSKILIYSAIIIKTNLETKGERNSSTETTAMLWLSTPDNLVLQLYFMLKTSTN